MSTVLVKSVQTTPKGYGLNPEEAEALYEQLAAWSELANHLRKPIALNLDGLGRTDIAALDYFVIKHGELVRSIHRKGKMHQVVVSSRVLQNISYMPQPEGVSRNLVPFATLRTVHQGTGVFENIWSCSWADVVMQIPAEHLSETAAFFVRPSVTVREPAPYWRYGVVKLFRCA